LKYYYKIENIYMNEEKKMKDSEIKYNNIVIESKKIKNNLEKTKLDNMHLNNALVNSKNEIDRLNIVIKADQKEMIKKQDEYNRQLKIEENKRAKLKNKIKVNERQISILQEKISESSLSKTMRMKKFRKVKVGEDEDEEAQKDDELMRLKCLVDGLQGEIKNLEKNLKKDREKKREIMEQIKNKRKENKFNNDNMKLLMNTIERQEEYGAINFSLVHSKNMIIKNLKERIMGTYNVPHYCLPKNTRINSAQK